MNDWRTILSWEIAQDINVGDRVKIIGPPNDLREIELSPALHGYEGRVHKIYRDLGDSENGAVVVAVKAIPHQASETAVFPLSHWRDYLEILS